MTSVLLQTFVGSDEIMINTTTVDSIKFYDKLEGEWTVLESSSRALIADRETEMLNLEAEERSASTHDPVHCCHEISRSWHQQEVFGVWTHEWVASVVL